MDFRSNDDLWIIIVKISIMFKYYTQLYITICAHMYPFQNIIMTISRSCNYLFVVYGNIIHYND